MKIEIDNVTKTHLILKCAFCNKVKETGGYSLLIKSKGLKRAYRAILLICESCFKRFVSSTSSRPCSKD